MSEHVMSSIVQPSQMKKDPGDDKSEKSGEENHGQGQVIDQTATVRTAKYHHHRYACERASEHQASISRVQSRQAIASSHGSDHAHVVDYAPGGPC
jgi:hypothetical protein